MNRKFAFIDSSQIIGRRQEDRYARIAVIFFLLAVFDIVRGIAIFFLVGMILLILNSAFHRYLESEYPHLQLDLLSYPFDAFKLKKRHCIAVMLMPFLLMFFSVLLLVLVLELFSWLSDTTFLP